MFVGVTLGQLGPDLLDAFSKERAADPQHQLWQNALTAHPVNTVALDRRRALGVDRSMSHRLDAWAVTNQQKSGRCWLFAGLNLLRVGAARQMGLKDFEFSQNHLLFWDKLEKANHWLEAVIALADRDVDDRTVAHLMASPTEDGGQWNMFVALVAKHGLVPQSVMPETASSGATHQLNTRLAAVLRQAARDLRAAAAAGDGAEQLRQRKEETLDVVHRMLSLHLGTPPERFTWQWTDKDDVFHREPETTPLEFAARWVDVPLEDYVCVVHDPRPGSPLGRTFTVEHLGNVVGAPPVVYLNVDIAQIKTWAQEAIVGGEPVWFGCDVDQMHHGDSGSWDAELYDYDGVYGTTTDLDKADRLLHGATAMTHAMMLTGVDVVDGRARRWRVENSWGAEKGDQGFWTMTDGWFDEYVFETAVRRDVLPADLRAALDAEPIVLPAWDPMGALARG